MAHAKTTDLTEMPVGTLLAGRYRLVAELGRGGVGVVYPAHDTLLDRDVAIKVLLHSSLSTGNRAHLPREARAAARLNHPNTVSVYDVGEADAAGGVPFIVMESVTGESLHSHRPQALDGVLSIARQVCAALKHAHTNGIIHRDLKPENVLIAGDGSAKLMGFGLARSTVSRLSHTGEIPILLPIFWTTSPLEGPRSRPEGCT